MPRARSAEIELRDQEIIAAVRNNVPRKDIARKYSITEGRVSQIIQSTLDLQSPDEDLREWLLQGYFGDMARLTEIADGPGRPVTSGKGDHVIDANSGEPAYDPSPKIDAIRNLGQVRNNIAKLMGVDKPPKRPQEDVVDVTQFLAAYTAGVKDERETQDTISKLKAQLAAVEGAVEAEVIDR